MAKHNVTQEDALAWHGSAECMKRVYELEALGREKFGENHWRKWKVSYFWTTAKKTNFETSSHACILLC